jgi:hypothetical protein
MINISKKITFLVAIAILSLTQTITLAEDTQNISDLTHLQLTQSSNQTNLLEEHLNILLSGRAWYKEQTQTYPFRIILQLRNEYEMTIQTTEFSKIDNSEPIFPFFSFELQNYKNKQYITPINGNIRTSGISKIPYRIERNRLIIESGSMIVNYTGGQKKIDLQGEYIPWLASFSRKK